MFKEKKCKTNVYKVKFNGTMANVIVKDILTTSHFYK